MFEVKLVARQLLCLIGSCTRGYRSGFIRNAFAECAPRASPSALIVITLAVRGIKQRAAHARIKARVSCWPFSTSNDCLLVAVSFPPPMAALGRLAPLSRADHPCPPSHGGQATNTSRAIVMQQKTQRPVQFEITEQTRLALSRWSCCLRMRRGSGRCSEDCFHGFIFLEGASVDWAPPDARKHISHCARTQSF
ncbi:hypothetical protein D3C81_204810 [compost metagenome]